MAAVRKPGYGTSKLSIWLNSTMAWLIILALVGGAIWGEPQAVALAPHVVSWMVILIMGLLGIHRFAGAMDMRALLDADRARNDPRPDAGGDPCLEPRPAERQKEAGDA